MAVAHDGKSTIGRSLTEAGESQRRLVGHPVHAGLRGLARIAPGLAGELAAYSFFLCPPRLALRTQDAELLARGERRMVPTRAGAMATRVFGPPGPVALLVHGWAGRGSQMLPLVDPLLAAGLRVVVPDLPGHGGSPGWRTSLPAWSEALIDLSRALAGSSAERSPIHAVVAHSLGAAALNLALGRGLIARRAVLVAPPASPAAYFEVWVGGVVDGDRFTALRGRVERRLGISFAELDGVRLAARHRTPALVVHDRDDRETPFHGGVAIARSWPRAEMLATSGLGHLRVLRDPAVAARVVAFATESVAVECGAAGCIRRPRPSGLCSNCELERELANPEARRVRRAS